MTCNFVQMFLLVYTKSQEESLGRGLFISCTKLESEFVLLHKTIQQTVHNPTTCTSFTAFESYNVTATTHSGTMVMHFFHLYHM